LKVTRVKCSNCQQMGHFKSRCTNPTVDEDSYDNGAAGFDNGGNGGGFDNGNTGDFGNANGGGGDFGASFGDADTTGNGGW